ncbi:hypothetical protein ScPMuIL_001728 [Solemya velum]
MEPDNDTQILCLEGNPSPEMEMGREFSYTFKHRQVAAYSIASDYGQKSVFVMRNLPGDIIRLDNVNIWLNDSALNQNVFHRGISNRVSHLALDWVHGNIYWTDGGFHWIAIHSTRMDDITMYKVLIHDLGGPAGIAVDPVNGYLFWSDIGAQSLISRSTLSGEDKTVLTHSGLDNPSGLVVDTTTRRLYWCDFAKFTVEYMDYDGGNRHMMHRINGASFYGISLYKDSILVTDYHGKRVISFDKERDTPNRIWKSLPGKPTGITIFAKDAQPTHHDVCLEATCDHLCVRTTDGKAQCLCKEGYTTQDEGYTCEVNTIYWKEVVFGIDNNTICIMDVRLLSWSGESSYVCSIKTIRPVEGLAIDMKNGSIFYRSGAAIYEYSLNMSSTQKLIESEAQITGMSYDWLADKLYWTEKENGRIMLISLKENSKLIVLSNVVLPGSIVTNPYESKLYWISMADNPTITSCNTDGTNVNILVSGTMISQSVDLAVDFKTGRIYWIDSEQIKSIKPDGSDLKHESTTFFDSHNIITYKDYLIWTENVSSGSRIKKVWKTHEHEPGFNRIDNHHITALAVFDVQIQQTERGICWVDNGDCEHVCIPHMKVKECRCHLGYKLQIDGISCRSEDSFFLVSDIDEDSIYRISLSDDELKSLGINSIGRPIGLTYNEEKKKIYWSDANIGIKTATLSGESAGIVLIVNSYTVMRIAVDIETGNLFYTGNNETMRKGYIGVVNEELGKHRLLVHGLKSPLAIALSPARGVMFWTDNVQGEISKSNMDGTNTQTIVSGLKWPNGLAIDNSGDKLYYVDGSTNAIGFVDLKDLGSKNIFFATDAHLRDIVFDGGYLYYIGWNRHYITQLEVKALSIRSKIAPKFEYGRLGSLYLVSGNAQSTNGHCGSNNGECSDFCLPTSSAKTCACGDGVKLRNDGRTCETDILQTGLSELAIILISSGAAAFLIVVVVAIVVFRLCRRHRSKNRTRGIANIEIQHRANPYSSLNRQNGHTPAHNGSLVASTTSSCNVHTDNVCGAVAETTPKVVEDEEYNTLNEMSMVDPVYLDVLEASKEKISQVSTNSNALPNCDSTEYLEPITRKHQNREGRRDTTCLSTFSTGDGVTNRSKKSNKHRRKKDNHQAANIKPPGSGNSSRTGLPYLPGSDRHERGHTNNAFAMPSTHDRLDRVNFTTSPFESRGVMNPRRLKRYSLD